ncbi:MAG: methanogenesis marker protein Mmp4/MtxX [Candidatus Methanomethylophilaceae archaeon]|jgi:putative methanogen marker protein 4|nr:methanogenesis marker protein Mmp4/MtxX [Candidatus Methanomethylophilaceae archaeon]MBR7005852.1 methanogenesis marker protein Mmp4/MtxX [Candidatus Methanomethylophilaceae archaeon]
MFTTETLLSSNLPDVVVGIGRGTDSGNVERSVLATRGHDVRIYDDPEELAGDLASGAIDAAIRGDMSSSVLLPIVKKKLGLKALERVVFMEPPSQKMFILAPVGIDEGWSNDQRFKLAVGSAKLAKRVGMGSKIAVMSGGRCEDVGRCKVVDKSIESARTIAKRLCEAGYEAYHSQILIEDAVRDADIIIAPEGITGNIIFRSLHFIGGVHALGAPVVNSGKVFIDTSRVKVDYRDSIALAMRLTEE